MENKAGWAVPGLGLSRGLDSYVEGISPLSDVQSPLTIGQITGFTPANLE